MSDKQPLTQTEFGESPCGFGTRLDYGRPKYRDPIFAILYYLHVAAIIGAGAYLWISQYPDIKDDTDTGISDVSLTGIIVAMVACMFCGIIFGLFWLEIIKRYASIIIKGMLFLNIGVWVAVVIVGVVIVNIPLIIIGAIFALIYCLWTWCIWSRIPFASALLNVSSNITQKYGGTVVLSLLVIVFNVLWMFLWGSAASAYLIVESEPHSGIIFLLLISFYWGFQVHQNISHTTTCGVTASWVFSSSINFNPTPAAFKRTMTTSFGSVCLGSLIVAFLQAVRAMIRASQNGKNNCLKCIALCLLDCIERLIQWFNKYAYAQCAIYGTSFVQSAKRTWNLLSTRGIMALINDDLTGMVIFAGALIGGVISAGVGYLIGYLFYNGNSESNISTGVPIGLAVYGFFIGLIFTLCVLYVVHSSVIALFVCYAEDPAALQQNRPAEYNMIVNAKPAFASVYVDYGNNPDYPSQQQQYNSNNVVIQPSAPQPSAPQQSAPQQSGYNDGNMYPNIKK